MTDQYNTQEILKQSEIPPESRTPAQQNLLKTLTTLLTDIEAEVGTDLDKPGYFYHITAPEDDPIVQLAGILPSSPLTDDIEAAWRQGVRVPPQVLGVGVAGNVVRHLSFREFMDLAPDSLARIREAMERDGGNYVDVTDDVMLERAEHYYYEKIVPNLPPAPHMPSNMRAHGYMVSVVLRDGSHYTASKSRGEDEVHLTLHSKEAITPLSTPTTLYLFLYGLEPDGENPDPLRAVEDFLTLQAIEKES